MTSPFEQLTSFQPVEYSDASERFSLENLPLHEPDALFGEEPETAFVHEGNVSLPGDLTLDDPSSGLYVIDGDLTIGGTLCYSGSDEIPVLYVTGTVRVGSLAIRGEAHLWIGASLLAQNYVLAELSDAGGLFVEGAHEAKAFIDLYGESPMLMESDSTAPFVQVSKYAGMDLNEGALSPESALAAPFNVAHPSFDAMVEAARAGASLLA